MAESMNGDPRANLPAVKWILAERDNLRQGALHAPLFLGTLKVKLFTPVPYR